MVRLVPHDKLWSGRIGRINYILGLIFFTILLFVIYTISSLLPIAKADSVLETVYILIFVILIPTIWIPLVVSLHIRRLHDRGHGGWWILMLPIDIWLNIFIKGQSSPNQYGIQPPKNAGFLKSIFNLY